MRRFCLLPSSWMRNRSEIGFQFELKIAQGELGTRRDTQKRRKSDRPLRPGREEIRKNIRPRTQRQKAMNLLFSGGLLLAFHDHLRIVRYLEKHLADRLEQRQSVPAELVLLGHDQDAVKKIAEAGLEAEDDLLSLGKIAFGDHRRDILLDDGKNGIELAFLFLDEQARIDGRGGLAGDDVVDALGHQDQRQYLRVFSPDKQIDENA